MQYLKMADFPHALTQAYIQLILLTFYVLFPYVINYVIRNNDAIIAKKQQTRRSQKKEHIKSGPGLRFVSFYTEGCDYGFKIGE